MGRIRHRAQRRTDIAGGRDAGHTGVEFVVVLCLVGLTASGVAMLVTGMRTEAAEIACATEISALDRAAARYLATTGGDSIPPAQRAGDTADTPDTYEHTLVEQGFLRSASPLIDLDASGTVIIPEESPC
jgi:type II secretory pathway pseudopilin PulG